MRVVFTTWGSLGDLHPYMALALELRRRGHDASIVTLGFCREIVERAGLGFYPLRPDVAPDDPGARELVRRVLDAKDGPRHLMLDVFAPVIDQTYDDTLAAVNADGGADLLVTHQVPLTGPVVAQKTGVPWVSAVLLPMGFLSEYDPPTPPQAPGLQKVAALHPIFGRTFSALGRRVTAPWVAPVYALRERVGLPRGGNPVFEGQHSPSLVLGLFSRLLSAKLPDFPPQTIVTGFPFYDAADQKPAPPELLGFLDAGEPPIVFTLGSSAVWIAEQPDLRGSRRCRGRRSPRGAGHRRGLRRARTLDSADAEGETGMKRCAWAGSDPLYVTYHDEEWGLPAHDDRHLFEMLILEGAQAGLSWITILRKRQAYRKAFAGFDPVKVAKFDARKIETLMRDEGIVRNRLKIEGAVRNARACLDVRREFGTFDRYIWQFTGGKPMQNARKGMTDVPATTPESDTMSRDLKKRGFTFVGSTICYAFMQATGMVNDHTTDCFRYRQVIIVD
jgi:DNA-3-methyladenine glycosylase I